MGRAGTCGRSDLRFRRPTAESLPAWAFGALVAAAVPLLLFHYGDYHWFHRDDWAFLTDSGDDWVQDIYRPHGGSHWVALPRMVYEGLWNVFGLTTYKPYQAFVVLSHVAVVVLVYRLARHAGARTSLAAAAAAVLVIGGPGDTNTVWAFQMTVNGSLAFGLAHALLADRDGALSRKDALGLVFGLLAITCSGVGVTTTVAVAIGVLARRGARAAALHASPLAVYGLWALLAGASTSSPQGRPAAGEVWSWVHSSVVGVFVAIGRFSILGVLLAALLVAGLGLALSSGRRTDAGKIPATMAMPLALVVGALFFASSTAFGRAWQGTELARSDRYVYIEAALLVPALAVAAEAVAVRWRGATPVLVGLLLLPIPFNVIDFDEGLFSESYMADRRDVLTTAVRMPFARDVPSDVEPARDPAARMVNMGFLLRALENGDLEPSTKELTPRVINEHRVRLGVVQRIEPGRPVRCRTSTEAVDLDPAVGDRFHLGSSMRIRTRDGERPTSRAVEFTPGLHGATLTIELPDLHLRVEPGFGKTSFTLCEEDS